MKSAVWRPCPPTCPQLRSGIPTNVRDTVGACDAFTAVLVSGLLRGESLTTIARDACETAAAVCAQPGAVPERSAVSETTSQK